MNRRNFKDPPSTCQASSDRRVFDIESDVLGSILTRGNILLLGFFGFTKLSL